MLREIETEINKELALRGITTLTVKVERFENGALITNLSRTNLSLDEKHRLNNAISSAWNTLKVKWFKEF
jgi:hypothetical protein